jgi:hypothetical protein
MPSKIIVLSTHIIYLLLLIIVSKACHNFHLLPCKANFNCHWHGEISVQKYLYSVRGQRELFWHGPYLCASFVRLLHINVLFSSVSSVNLECLGRKCSCCISGYYSGIHLESLRETMKILSEYSLCHSWDSNWENLDYKSESYYLSKLAYLAWC